MSTKEERAYIGKLMAELCEDFEGYAREYQQDRDLGALGEFANLYRKARKLKTLMWPGENARPLEPWREDLRTIVKEVASHALLLLVDLDKANGNYGKWLKAIEVLDKVEAEEEGEEPLTPQGEKADRTIRREQARELARELARLRRQRAEQQRLAAAEPEDKDEEEDKDEDEDEDEDDF